MAGISTTSSSVSCGQFRPLIPKHSVHPLRLIPQLIRPHEGAWMNVCSDLADPPTRDREVRRPAAAEFPNATPLLVTLDAVAPQPSLDKTPFSAATGFL